MKTQFTEQNDVNCLSEFDPALIFCFKTNYEKLVLGSIRAYNLCRREKDCAP